MASTTIDTAAEITRLESQRDSLDQRWRRLRHAGVQTPEQGRARDIELAAVEVQYRDVEVALARLHVESCERRLVSVDDVDAGALAQAQAEFDAARVALDSLLQLQHGAHVRRRDAEADLKQARRTLAEAEYALEQRRQRLAEAEARPVRRVLPAAMLIGDHRH
jgi:chromosome segregation ATPase